MLVGDVREARRTTGCSWKLSGGSQFSSAVTKVSKKCHVFRAVARMKKVWDSERCSGFGSMDRLMRQAMKGAATQSAIIGDTKDRRHGSQAARPAAMATARKGSNHMAA